MAKHKKDKSASPTIENRRARHDYHIGDTLEVGIRLVGTEVKAVRDGNVSLGEGYVSIRGEPPELSLHNVSIGEYAPAGAMQHALSRTRRLLAHKQEIKRLARQMDQKGMTLVPLKLYFKDGWAKLLIGVGTGKAQFDKRQAIKERDNKRGLQRLMSQRG